MRTITANVFYPVFGIEVQVPDDATKGEIRLALLHAAARTRRSQALTPFIVDSNEPTVNDPLGISLE